jgi:DNA/RNA-binding domain of Phe-tRNA-synthetase-like protein
MRFRHSDDLWRDHPDLVPGVLIARGITNAPRVDAAFDRFTGIAAERLALGPESEFPEIQAWRRAFSRMGLKPTQYRCAAESLLRRFRKDGSLPRLHPMIDVCNAASLAFAIPIAVFDIERIAGDLTVRYATGAETFSTFAGEHEHPDPNEVVFADAEGRAHARRWTHRQGADSAVRPETRSVLIVAEAMHSSARSDITRLTEALAKEIDGAWGVTATTGVLSAVSPLLDVGSTV